MTSYSHPEWELGEPCPECDNPNLRVIQASEERYKAVDGEMEYVDFGSYKEYLLITCQHCGTQLKRHPAMEVLD